MAVCSSAGILQAPDELGAPFSASEAASPQGWWHVPCWSHVAGVFVLEIPPAEQLVKGKRLQKHEKMPSVRIVLGLAAVKQLTED